MPRPPRTDFPGAFHHVMHRGARRAPIFARPDDSQLLLDTIEDTVARFDVEVHGYSLMPNHFHVILRSLSGELSSFMRVLDGQYTQRLNRRHRWDGPVFRGRFRSQLIRRPRHLRHLLPYLHLNPVRARLVKSPEDECWTSHRAYLGLEPTPAWLTTRYFLRLLGGRTGLTELVTGLHQGRIPWPAGFDLDSGWLPEEADAEQDVADEAAVARAATAPRPTADEVLRRVAAISGTAKAQLLEARRGPRANPARRFAVWALVRHARLSQPETARILEMTTTAVAKVMWRLARGPAAEPLQGWIKEWGRGGRGAEPPAR